MRVIDKLYIQYWKNIAAGHERLPSCLVMFAKFNFWGGWCWRVVTEWRIHLFLPLFRLWRRDRDSWVFKIVNVTSQGRWPEVGALKEVHNDVSGSTLRLRTPSSTRPLFGQGPRRTYPILDSFAVGQTPLVDDGDGGSWRNLRNPLVPDSVSLYQYQGFIIGESDFRSNFQGPNYNLTGKTLLINLFSPTPPSTR